MAGFGFGCFSAGVSAWMGASLKVQLLTSAITSLVVFWAIRPVFIRYFSGGERTVTGVLSSIGGIKEMPFFMYS